MKKKIKNPEAGVAMIMALLALLVLSAIAAGLVYMTNTETLVNSNYRSEQVAYFAAKAGMEEARDRMMLNLPGGYYFSNMAPNPLPTTAPTDNNGGVLYIVNEGNQPGTVQPWVAGNAYMDDEICHDGYALSGVPSGGNLPDPDVHCTSGQLPSGSSGSGGPGPGGGTWWQSTTSQLPYNGTAAALPFKWVRVSLKLNGSVQNYLVNSQRTAKHRRVLEWRHRGGFNRCELCGYVAAGHARLFGYVFGRKPNRGVDQRSPQAGAG